MSHFLIIPAVFNFYITLLHVEPHIFTVSYTIGITLDMIQSKPVLASSKLTRRLLTALHDF